MDDHSRNHVDAGAGKENNGVVVMGCVKYTADDRGGESTRDGAYSAAEPDRGGDRSARHGIGYQREQVSGKSLMRGHGDADQHDGGPHAVKLRRKEYRYRAGGTDKQRDLAGGEHVHAAFDQSRGDPAAGD